MFKINLLSNNGVSLIVVIFIMVIFSAIGLIGVSLIATTSQESLNTFHSTQALFLAESAMYYTLANQLAGDDDWSDNEDILNKTLSIGTFDVEYQSQTETMATIKFTGRIDDVTRQIIHTFENSGGWHEAFNYYAYVENHIHCNNAEGTIDGSLRAGGSVHNRDPDDMPVTGPIEEGISSVMPYVEYSYYESIADNTSTSAFTESESPYSGIYYYDGNVTIGDNVTINGSIIATGNISLHESENVNINPTSTYPALVAGNNIAGGQLEDSIINGVIYSENNINLQNSEDNRFDGVIISGNNLNFNNSENEIGAYTLTEPPPGFEGGPGEVQMGTWSEAY